MEEVNDSINCLPEELLSLILSFLPTKEAVATSLSIKSWRKHWTFLTTINLNSNDFKDVTFFHQFVDNLLSGIKLENVKKFVLLCNYNDYEPHNLVVRGWINDVIDISKELEYLELHSEQPCVLPSHFSANELKVLKLSGQVLVEPRSDVNLPSLEALDLKSVRSASATRILVELISSRTLVKYLLLKF
ncbi:hypothetical protein QN277_024982 [Acacia crassicarpa]|nr:hypothetical protein QN277_024982 [Acacia crassicarpa]